MDTPYYDKLFRECHTLYNAARAANIDPERITISYPDADWHSLVLDINRLNSSSFVKDVKNVKEPLRCFGIKIVKADP